MGIDTQTTDFTVVGVGDMSGDVFGNGMLLSPHIRLVAAFDHRHVFLDPNPDPATSFAERARMFALERSSWADYDPAAISAGGGVYPRTANDPAVAGRAGRTRHRRACVAAGRADPRDPAGAGRPAANGGIGTYVKAARETHLQVGDRANDAVRVNGTDLRCKVIGEGGNLGCTQFGRIEFAQRRPHQHRCDRQLGRCRLFGSRSQHQDPARPSCPTAR